jgi:hypothetical protein
MTTLTRSLFPATAVAVVVIVFVGFLPTYWAVVVVSPDSIQPLLHLHAVLFFGWAVLFLVQSILVSRNRLDLHRGLGKIAAAWALVTIITGTWLAFVTITRDLELIDGTFRAVTTVIPLTQICMFTCLVAAALANTGNPDAHKRFMVLAALVATTPALARIGLAVLGEPSPMLVGSIFLTSNGLIVVVAWFDTSRSGRLHPVFLYGGLGI